jgi:hypothetical protein
MSTPNKIKNLEDGSSKLRLRFPATVTYDNHFMQFLPKKYEYGGASRVGFVEKVDSGGTITLPLPKNLSESYNAEWSSEPIGAVGDAAARFTSSAGGGRDALSTLTDIGVEQIMKLVSNDVAPIIGAILGSGGGTLGTAAGAIIGALGQQGATGALAGAGIASNPYLATLFKGINFRNHTFSFELFAKSPSESGQIRRIINRFRYNMLPAYNENVRSIFDYPSIFHIAFMDSSYLFDFKPCVLTSMNVNYHGQGDAFYFDLSGKKIPASIILDLNFLETEIVTKNDFENENVKTARGWAPGFSGAEGVVDNQNVIPGGV